MKTALIFTSLMMTASLSTAAPTVLTIDPTHSSVGFSVRHLVSNVKGWFTDFSGTLTVDEKDPLKSSVSATIKTSSIDTRNPKRDEHLKNADFFNVEKFPEITFNSKKITKNGKKYKVDGVLKMNGVEKDVTLDMEYTGQAKDPWGKTRAGFTATTTIKRSEFGLKWNKALETGGVLIGDDVKITLDIEAIKEEGEAKKAS